MMHVTLIVVGIDCPDFVIFESQLSHIYIKGQGYIFLNYLRKSQMHAEMLKIKDIGATSLPSVSESIREHFFRQRGSDLGGFDSCAVPHASARRGRGAR